MLALNYRGPRRTVVVVHNFGTGTATVDLGGHGPLEELFPTPRPRSGPLTLGPAASVWLATIEQS